MTSCVLRRNVGLALICLLGISRGASAQDGLPPSDVVANKLFNVLFAAGLGDEFPGTMLRAIAGQLSSYPVGTSSGGFTYSFDPKLGFVGRSSRGFGPVFAERALTIGNRKVSFGFTFQRTTFDRFEGLDLTALSLYRFPNSSREMSLNLTTETAATIVQVGVLPRLDVGVIVPAVRVNMNASVEAIAGNQRFVRADRGTSSGIGDVILKAKYNAVTLPGGGVAAAVDLRLPTGDKYKLLGAGATRLKLFGVASGEIGVLAPHVNIGMTTQSAGDCGPTASVVECYLGSLPREFNFSGGVDVIASPHLTILAEMIGDRVSRTRRFFYFEDDVLDWDFDSLTRVLGSTGVKFSAGPKSLVIASVLFPLNKSGLSSHLAVTIGFDHAF